MWENSESDPEGPSTSRELTDLKSQNEQQQLLIAQLKEMLRKEHSNVPQEKVEEYIQTLSKVKAKKTRSKKEEYGNIEKESTVDSNKKVNLLKQQLEANKVKLAERGKSQKGMEEMVSQLQAQLFDSQQILKAAPISALEHKHLGYNKNTSQEELYGILTIREKQISEMISKTQKQEAIIIDLQDNLKEKDQVIEARTKAITLMTDSLSKKGKDTLDALDDTKEQMRRMQEDFVKLEEEMKSRQMALLNDLKAKNLEITELQELNQHLENENKVLTEHLDEVRRSLDVALNDCETYKNKVTTLDKDLQDVTGELNRLKNTGSYMSSSENAEKEIAKLKRQLEESNKSMIKMKAQSRSKIKELTKSIETFKKMGDANALVVQLQAENVKLTEKIAELEEEKGNLQLKMVESTDFGKDFECTECKALLEKIQKQTEQLEEKDKVISLIEVDILSSKKIIEELNEKIAGLSHLQSSQVTSEMKSIQIEEQLDKLENENSMLKEDIEILSKDKAELNNRIDEVIKEKAEINSKLENYIQENMELIDKLEKLSAEKVSSAESIEIVEGLTQQEKLELAAYQKIIEEPHKNAGDDVTEEHEARDRSEGVESTEGLNETVIQLNEEWTQLLKRIEQFNSERKDILCKMEHLKEENNRLTLRISEVENNRDILAETYEQLQTEKEQLQCENEKLTKQIEILESGCEGQAASESINNLRAEYKKLLHENTTLKQTLKDLDGNVSENCSLERNVNEYITKINDLESKLKDSLTEMENYQAVIAENKNELINSSDIINNLNSTLRARENEIRDLNSAMDELNQVVSTVQKENENLGNFEDMEAQIDELKCALKQQMGQAESYAKDISHNNNIITGLKQELNEMHEKILEAEHESEMKKIELETLSRDIQNKDDIIQSLQNQIKEKDEKIHLITEEMTEKYLILQKQLDGNQRSIDELTNKNKEQMEKMKKIAASLKKKTHAYQELEEKYMAEKKKWETETNLKENNQITVLSEQIRHLQAQLDDKQTNLQDFQSKIQQLTDHIQHLEYQNVELQNLLLDAKNKQDKLNEVTLKQELSTSLHEEFEPMQQGVDISEEKIKEMQLIIETDEFEITKCKERIEHLEQANGALLSEREQLQYRLSEVEGELKAIEKEVKDKMNLEEAMGHKIEDLAMSEGELSKKLHIVSVENEALSMKVKEQEEIVSKLKVKLKKAHEKIQQLKNLQTTSDELEKTNEELRKQITILDTNLTHAQGECEILKKQSRSDYENIESDYQLQLDELQQSRGMLSIECEKLKEDLKVVQDREQELLMELDEYKDNLKVLQDREQALLRELDEYKRKLQEDCANSSDEIHRLTQSLHQTTTDWKAAVDEINILKQQIDQLQTDLVTEEAKQAVREVINEAVEKVGHMSTIGTKTARDSASGMTESPWSGADLHEHVTKSETHVQGSLPVASTSSDPVEELQQKIQDIQLTLSNIDQDILQHCLETLKALVSVVNKKVALIAEPVTTIDISDIESQVQIPEQISTNKQELQRIEFQSTGPCLGEQCQAVVEEVVQPKKAYLTYHPGMETSGENDDGWGWGPEEGKLEEEYIQKSESATLRLELVSLKEKLQVLQNERDGYIEEIKQVQAKAGKLVKKCKELKQKNDELMSKKDKSDGGDFFDLNKTIEEELKTQIAQLERKIKELTMELEKQKQEKSNILKRVDALTAANEKMVEMKEIQESEVFRWKRKYDEVEKKIRELELGSDGFSEGPKIEKNTDGTEELQRTIKELMLDNEELQVLLNEQKQLKIDAEKSKTGGLDNTSEKMEVIQELTEQKIQLEQLVSEKDSALNELKLAFDQSIAQNEKLQIEIKELQEKLEQLRKEYIDFQSSSNQYAVQMEEQSRKFKELESTKEQLQKQLEQTVSVSIVAELEQQLNEARVTNNQYQSESAILQSRLLELQSENSNIGRELESYKQSGNENVAKIEGLEREITTTKQMYNDASKLVTDMQKKLEDEQKRYAELRFDYETKTSTSGGKSENEREHSELWNALEENKNQVMFLESEVERLKGALEEKQSEIDVLKKTMEQESAKTAEELERKWQEQVDERGNAVAESWKYHLAIVEAEFGEVQNKLKSEINELETKCNALVNENNELRKNVDTEIRNDVVRLSSLQQQINERQQKIQDLQVESNDKLRLIETEKELLQRQLHDKDSEIANLRTVISTTQRQFEEKREILEDIVKLLEANTSWPLSCERQIVVDELQRQLSAIHEKEQQVQSLNEHIIQLRSQLTSCQIDDEEMFNLKNSVTALQTQLESTSQELIAAQKEKLAASQIVDDYEAKLMEYKLTSDSLKKALEEKNQEIEAVTQRLKEAEQLKNDNNKGIEQLSAEIYQLKQDAAILQQSLSDCQQQLFSVTQKLTAKSNEMETVNAQFNYSQQNVQILENELCNLKELLENKEREHATSLEAVKQDYFKDLEHHYQELLNMKESEIRSLETKLDEHSIIVQKLQGSLEETTKEKSALVAKINELETEMTRQIASSSEREKHMEELNKIIEDQVMRIEELKKELYQKSSDYDSLIAEIEVDRKPVVAQPRISEINPSIVSASEEIPVAIAAPSTYTDKEVDLSEPVSRAELDLALYMLHQRDVRCEELTVELTQLLEERDTLQLRLSNAIREKEELSRMVITTATETSSGSVEAVPSTSSSRTELSKSSAIFLAASGTELASEPSEQSDSHSLATKLLELKSVGYKKDKTFVDEQESRRLQQIAIMQQHFQEAAKLPPEAAAKLVDASYTLSRDVQSPSKVLLNWLWGRSTPKVNDT